MLRELINLANKLDSKGLRKEANQLDIVIKKVAQSQGGSWQSNDRPDYQASFGNKGKFIQDKLYDLSLAIAERAKASSGGSESGSDPRFLRVEASGDAMAGGVLQFTYFPRHTEPNSQNNTIDPEVVIKAAKDAAASQGLNIVKVINNVRPHLSSDSGKPTGLFDGDLIFIVSGTGAPN